VQANRLVMVPTTCLLAGLARPPVCRQVAARLQPSTQSWHPRCRSAPPASASRPAVWARPCTKRCASQTVETRPHTLPLLLRHAAAALQQQQQQPAVAAAAKGKRQAPALGPACGLALSLQCCQHRACWSPKASAWCVVLGDWSGVHASHVLSALACDVGATLCPSHVPPFLPPALPQVALRFQPASLVLTELRLACVFNHSASSSAALLLSGAASEPQLAWDLSSSRLFFRPTCVGAASQRQLTVRNVSRVPVGWQWVLSRKLQDAVTVEPMVRRRGGGLRVGPETGLCVVLAHRPRLLNCLLRLPAAAGWCAEGL
jgi:hypothetical protein